MLILKLYQKAADSDRYKLVGGGEYPTIDTPDAFARKINVTKEPGFIGRELSDGDVIEVSRKDGSEFYRYDGAKFERTEFDVKTADRSEAIECIYVAPGERARELIVGKSLAPLQNALGGYIECFYPFEDQVGIVCNEEGKLEGLPLNRAFRDDDGSIIDIVAGNYVIVGLSEDDDFCSLSDQQLQTYKDMFLLPEKFIQFNNEIIAYTYNPAQSLHL